MLPFASRIPSSRPSFVGGNAFEEEYIGAAIAFPVGSRVGDTAWAIGSRPTSGGAAWDSKGNVDGWAIWARRIAAADLASKISVTATTQSLILAIYRGLGPSLSAAVTLQTYPSSEPVTAPGFTKAAGTRALFAISASDRFNGVDPDSAGGVGPPGLFITRYEVSRSSQAARIRLADCLNPSIYADGSDLIAYPPNNRVSFSTVFQIF